jgi:hypothetical protein
LLDDEGKALVKPNGITSPIINISINGLDGVKCVYQSDGTVFENATLYFTNTDNMSITGISGDVAQFDPIFTQVINSFRMDKKLIGDWGDWGK